jgi:hypothetical protein
MLNRICRSAALDITYDEKSFIINSQRVFLTSGSLHYFRAPRALWRDRLEKAKAAGLNTIQFYVPWNWHEPCDNEFDWSGERDLDYFISLAEELGLWVVARPGPYICAEWDGGGFPAWLYQKKGIEVRHYNPIYLQYMDRYLDHVIPIIARHQVTRGGGVILVQAENELNNVSPEDASLYMRHLVDGYHQRGIDTPIITCAGGTEYTIECVNSHTPADQFQHMREKQPNAPIHCTEFWPGWYCTWDREKEQWYRSPAEVEMETWRVLANGGAGYNYYMWFGGTNFAYTTMYLQTTSYDFTAPLSEAGGIWEKYHRCRRVALFAQQFSSILTTAEEGNPADIHMVSGKNVRCLQRVSEQGKILFVQNPENEAQIVSCNIENRSVKLLLAPRSVHPVVYDTPLDPSGAFINFCTAGILKIHKDEKNTIVILYGEPWSGAEYKLSIGLPEAPTRYEDCDCIWEDGKAHYDLVFSDQARLSVIHYGERTLQLLLLPTYLADRTWWDMEAPASSIPTIYTGAYYRNPDSSLELKEEDKYVQVLSSGKISSLEIPDHPLLDPPVLSSWQYANGAIESNMDFDPSEGVGMYHPMNRVYLDARAGYAWYRTVFDSDRERQASLTFTAFSDRILVFLNGEHLISTLPPAEDRIADPCLTLEVNLRKGKNTLAVLTDNLGHLKGAWQFRGRPQEEDKKGLFGPVLLDHAYPISNWRFLPGLTGEREGWVLSDIPSDVIGAANEHVHRPSPEWLPMSDATGKHENWFRAVFKLSHEERMHINRELFLDVQGMKKGVIWVNGINMGRYWTMHGHTLYYLPKAWLLDENEIILYEEESALPDNVRLVWDAKANASLTVCP